MRRPFRRISNIVSEMISAKALPGRGGPYNEGPATSRRPPMDTIKPLFTATATATGGRNGYTESTDGAVKANLSVPKEMGGPGKPGTATPEHLFAAGYAACFGGALDFVGKRHKKDAAKARITCAVTIGPRDGGGFGLAVKLSVQDKSLPQADLAGRRREAQEQISPDS